jgi:hypothetical protein
MLKKWQRAKDQSMGGHLYPEPYLGHRLIADLRYSASTCGLCALFCNKISPESRFKLKLRAGQVSIHDVIPIMGWDTSQDRGLGTRFVLEYSDVDENHFNVSFMAIRVSDSGMS